MQDPLSFTFCWGETFDTAPYRTQSRLVSSRRASVVVQRYDFCMVTRVDWATYIVWQIVWKGRPILMRQISSTWHGTKKSHGRDQIVPREGRNGPHEGVQEQLRRVTIL